MNPPSREVCVAILEGLSGGSRSAIVVADEGGTVVWANRMVDETFPGCFAVGARLEESLSRCSFPECSLRESDGISANGISPSSAFVAGGLEGEVRRSTVQGSQGTVFRHVRIPIEAEGNRFVVHQLINVSDEKRFREHYIQNLRQLKIMKEIVDVLYESIRTQEVIYLTLVAVTSQMGFGFNRAFFLQTKGSRLRGRIGIGPSSPEEAHQIWTRVASLNFSTLREVYEDLARNGDAPDPRTQEVALSLDVDVSAVHAECGIHGEGSGPATLPLPGILGVIQRGKPACMCASEAETEADRRLFSLLATDSIAVVPIWVRGRLDGVVIADNLVTRKPITDSDLNVLKTFAGYAGVALERSSLYDELRDNVEKLRAANESLKTNQQKLLQVEKLSAIGELAAYVSHEIRNPLVAIGGLARSLLKDEIGDPETVETLQIIVSEVTRLEKFLKDTLDYVKPRAAATSRVDLNAVVRDSLATFRNELAQNAIEVELDLASDAPRAVTDRSLIVHALSNLLKNAIEAIGADGSVYLSTRTEGGLAVLRVGDSGSGIPPEVAPRIFDPFFTTKSEGTGLGLALAFQNIRGLGGNLELEGHSKFKTLFKLTLPMEENALRGVRADRTVAAVGNF